MTIIPPTTPLSFATQVERIIKLASFSHVKNLTFYEVLFTMVAPDLINYDPQIVDYLLNTPSLDDQRVIDVLENHPKMKFAEFISKIVENDSWSTIVTNTGIQLRQLKDSCIILGCQDSSQTSLM